jgi:ankyrin repeat protein
MALKISSWNVEVRMVLVVGLSAWFCSWAGPACGSDAIEQLMSACSRGNTELAGQLVRQGANVNGRGKAGDTPLTDAVRMNRAAVVRFLLDNGADPNLADGLGDPPLLIAAKTWKKVDMLKLLLEKGADPNVGGQLENTPLIETARWGGTELVTLLLAHGADVNKRGGLETTPLIAACTTRMAGRTPTVKALLDAGADVTLENRFGSTALNAAKINKNEELVKFLTERGVKE